MKKVTEKQELRKNIYYATVHLIDFYALYIRSKRGSRYFLVSFHLTAATAGY